MKSSIHSDILRRLSPELRELLDAELAVGNAIADAGPGLRGKDSVLVLLAQPFRATPAALPPGVQHRVLNDPHWWQAEYVHAASGHCLACRA
ncbi:MAG: hypothetical protein JNL39_00565 [Opitutaceae bacterium]|nr:hypothetical protein [Opitutaceae bacterium]